MRETNYLVFSRATMKEIVEDYVQRTHNMKVTVKEFGQKKYHNAAMYEATLSSDADVKRDITE